MSSCPGLERRFSHTVKKSKTMCTEDCRIELQTCDMQRGQLCFKPSAAKLEPEANPLKQHTASSNSSVLLLKPANTPGHSFRGRTTPALQYGQSARDCSHCSRQAEWKMCLQRSWISPSDAPWHPSRHIEQSTEDSASSSPSIVPRRVSCPTLQTGLGCGAATAVSLNVSAVICSTLWADREALELKRKVRSAKLPSSDEQISHSEGRSGPAQMIPTAGAVSLLPGNKSTLRSL